MHVCLYCVNIFALVKTQLIAEAHAVVRLYLSQTFYRKISISSLCFVNGINKYSLYNACTVIFCCKMRKILFYSIKVYINIRLHHSGIFDRVMHTLNKYYNERRPFDCCLFSQHGCYILSVRGPFVWAGLSWSYEIWLGYLYLVQFGDI